MKQTDTEWIHRPRQERSQDTTDRILEAATRLIENRDLDDVPVTEIARAAKVSVGGFYARFPSKTALLHAFDDYVVGLCLREVRRRMDPHKLQGVSAEGVVRTYIRMAIAWFSKHRTFMRQVCLKARATNDAAYVARTRAFNEECHGRLRDCLLLHRAEIAHPEPAKACEFAVMMVSAAMREIILFGDRKMNLSTIAGRQLCDELTRAFCSYLGIQGSGS